MIYTIDNKFNICLYFLLLQQPFGWIAGNFILNIKF